jgi:predicted phosphodiesterase
LRQAIVSDIHGNQVALEAVLADIESETVDEIVCLGDVIGYGPKPRECLRVALDFRPTLLGNHEEAVLYGAVGFNEKAKNAIDWTREELLSRGASGEADHLNEDRRLWDFIGGLKKLHRDGETVYAHGSPRDPTREYIFTQDRFDHHKMNEIFASFDGRVCFVGHTHIPGVFEEDYSFQSPVDLDGTYRLNEKKALVNVGSVGQPRDGDPRACYVIFDFETVRYRRVAYDIEHTIANFAATPLPGYLARRLREGK